MKSLCVALCCLTFGACSKPVGCERTYELLKECSGRGFDTDKDRFLARCEAEKGKAETQAIVACSEAETCVDFHACTEKAAEEAVAAHRKERLAEDTARLRSELEAGRYKQAQWTCEAIRDALAGQEAPEAAMCDGLPKRALEALTLELTALRDRGKEDAGGTCADLRDFAKAVSAGATVDAKRLCDEVAASAHAAEALLDVRQRIEDKQYSLPLGCSLSLGELGKVESEYAKKRAGEVAEACYVALGKPLLAARLPAMKGACDYEVRSVVNAVKTWGLKDADLAALVEKARPLCDANRRGGPPP